MLREAEGCLLDAAVDALVDTLNTIGVMGKGIAVQFRQAYPGSLRACERRVSAVRFSWARCPWPGPVCRAGLA
jgi:O-acetyl-ADP-ribose deacetylase (regulator of RNase III)